MKTYFSSPVATAEFSKFASILNAALSQHHLSGFEIAQLFIYFIYTINNVYMSIPISQFVSLSPSLLGVHTFVFCKWDHLFHLLKLVLEKAEEPKIKLPTSAGSWKSKRISEKHLFLLSWLCQSLWLCGSQQTVENSERDGNTRPPDLPLEKPVCRSGSNSYNWTWNNRLVPNRERSTSRLYIVTLLI